jgi:hypothetical protein
MITAQEAKILSDSNYELRKNKAEKWAQGELEHIEDSIQRAIEDGKYSTDYWWSYEILKEADIKLGMAANAFKAIFKELGYGIHCDWNTMIDECDSPVLRIIISWENVK